MPDDEFKKMRAFEQAAAEAGNLYRIPASEEILRLAGYRNDWQRQQDAIAVLTTSQRLNLRHLLPLTAEDEMERLRAAMEPSPMVFQMMRDIEEQAKRSEKMLSDLTENLVSSSVLSGYASLNQMLHEMGVQAAAIPSFARLPEFAINLLAPAEQYGRFLHETVSQLATFDSESTMSRALQGSIVLAEDILGANADLIGMMTANVVESPIAPTTSAEGLVLPFVQREELVANRENLVSLDVDDLSFHSAAHGIARRANAVVQAIVDVNTARKLKQKREIFIHTNRSVLAVRDLVLLVVRDARSLGDFLDTLYVLFYEGAGDDHLRYLDSEGGELTSDECEIVWIIKHLRNYARHDLDHGKPTDVRKKWRTLDVDLNVLGFSRMPTTEFEFRRLQARLLELAEELLNRMLGRIQ